MASVGMEPKVTRAHAQRLQPSRKPDRGSATMAVMQSAAANGNNAPLLVRKFWSLFALNLIGPVLVFSLFASYYNFGMHWDSELLSVLGLVVGHLSALVGGLISISQLRVFIEARGSSAVRSGWLLAAMTLPLSAVLSVPHGSLNPFESYLERHFNALADPWLLVTGTLTYALVAFLVGAAVHRLAITKTMSYSRLTAITMLVLICVQLASLALEVSMASF